MKFKSSQGNYNALEQDKMLKEHETHAMLNVISFFFIRLLPFQACQGVHGAVRVQPQT